MSNLELMKSECNKHLIQLVFVTNAIKTAKKNTLKYTKISYTLAVGYVKVEVYGLNTDHLKNLHYNKIA